MNVIYTIAAVLTGCTFLFSALLVVCRSFALQQPRNSHQPYEARLWAKYASVAAVETKRAA